MYQPNVEEMMQRMVKEMQRSNEAMVREVQRNIEAKMEGLQRRVDNQMGQIAKQISERPQGALPSDTIPNPREHVQAITLRSGRTIEAQSKDEMDESKVGAKGDDVEFDEPMKEKVEDKEAECSKKNEEFEK